MLFVEDIALVWCETTGMGTEHSVGLVTVVRVVIRLSMNAPPGHIVIRSGRVRGGL